MKTETSEVARQYRLMEWVEMNKECNARPENMSVSEWCKEHSITTANYYYRLAEVRKALLKNTAENTSTAIVLFRQNLCRNKRKQRYLIRMLS